VNFCYIIYSPKIGKYYIGETEDFEKRLSEHNTGVFKNSYTKQANDWEKHLIIECNDRSEARFIELYLKKMKNSKYYKNLQVYPEIIEKAKEKYRGS
jgi:putative endonuclease